MNNSLHILSESSVSAKYMLVSFDPEGFMTREEMPGILRNAGDVKIFQVPYNAFRASLNQGQRPIHVSKYLYVVENINQ
jgi:adenine-specific DNA-methyltransferase